MTGGRIASCTDTSSARRCVADVRVVNVGQKALADADAEARIRSAGFSPAEDVDVRFEGADHGRIPPPAGTPGHRQGRSDLRAGAAPLPRRRSRGGDPDRLRDERCAAGGRPRSPFRLIVPHWYAVASVKWLKGIDVLTERFAGEFQTGHYIYEWPDRPHEAVSLMRVRARITDPAPGSILSSGTHTVRGKAWSGTGPVTPGRHEPHRRRRLARGPAPDRERPLPVAGLVMTVNNARICLSMTLGEAVRQRQAAPQPVPLRARAAGQAARARLPGPRRDERYLDSCIEHYRPLAES